MHPVDRDKGQEHKINPEVLERLRLDLSELLLNIEHSGDPRDGLNAYVDDPELGHLKLTNYPGVDHLDGPTVGTLPVTLRAGEGILSVQPAESFGQLPRYLIVNPAHVAPNANIWYFLDAAGVARDTDQTVLVETLAGHSRQVGPEEAPMVQAFLRGRQAGDDK